MKKIDKKFQIRKILWAVDAFPQNATAQIEIGKTLKTIIDPLSAIVHPVYVSKPLPSVFVTPKEIDMEKKFTALANKNLKKIVASQNLVNVAPPLLLSVSVSSVSAQVRKLLQYAVKEKFDLIVVGTHCKSGISRIFMGSFAEKLILESPLPLLIVNAKTHLSSKKIKNILFPTDFSDSSKEVFERVIDLAKTLETQITIFHHEEFIDIPVLYPFAAPSFSQEPLKKMRADWKKWGKKWVLFSKKKGVPANFHMSRGLSTASEITKLSEMLPNSFIAMASQSNKFETLVLGSVARQVVRSASKPIYVLHPQKK